MRNLGLLAFGITTCVLVPAAIHQLRAGHDQVVKFAAPDIQTLELAGAKIEARLEHPLVDPGEPIHLRLTAAGATGKRLKIGVLVYGTSGSEGDRVPSPPVGVAHETVTLAIDAAGTGSKELSVALRGAAASRYNTDAAFTHYTVMVMAPAAADKLDMLHRNSELLGGEQGIPDYNKSAQHFMSLYRWGGDLKGEDAKLYAAGAIARLDAYTRQLNPAIVIEAPATTAVGQAFTATVVVKNPGKEAALGLVVTLDTPTGVVDDSEGGGISALVMPDSADFDLAAGETRRFTFRVMPDERGVLGLYARVTCKEYDCKAPEALTLSGTFDATEIVPVETTDSIIGSR